MIRATCFRLAMSIPQNRVYRFDDAISLVSLFWVIQGASANLSARNLIRDTERPLDAVDSRRRPERPGFPTSSFAAI